MKSPEAEIMENFVLIPECPLCGADKFRKCIVLNGIEYVNCGCGMVFQPMYMTQEQVSEYYKDTYRKTVGEYENTVTKYNLRHEIDRAKRQVNFINVAVLKRHLDVGSSTGTFLKLMKEKYGCESLGVEPGDVFRDYSNKSGINSVADISEVDGKFDFISMSHVLEHLIDPLEMLETVRGLLEDDGHLFLEVPVMCPSIAHPLMFFDLTLEKMLNKAEFEIMNTSEKSPLMTLAKKKG